MVDAVEGLCMWCRKRTRKGGRGGLLLCFSDLDRWSATLLLLSSSNVSRLDDDRKQISI